MLGVAVGVHQHDRDGPYAALERLLQCLPRRGGIQGSDDRAVGSDPLVDLDHVAVQQFRQHDLPIEQPWAILVGDAKRIAESARHREQKGLALAFEKRVGRHRGSHLHDFDLARRDRLAG